MVYYLTSNNVKLLRKILLVYNEYSEITPHEFIKNYIEQSGDSIHEKKSEWMVETFLGVQKHRQFLKEIMKNSNKDLFEEEQDYFIIIFYAITFQISWKHKDLLYKCLINLNKKLFEVIVNFFSNEEALAFVRQIAQSFYDIRYIAEKIMAPLHTWQPYIVDMRVKYLEYVQNMKPPLTVPVPPNLTVKLTETLPPPILTPPTMPLTLPQDKKMLTKDLIDQKLQQEFEKNKERAIQLLNDVKATNHHYAQNKSEKYHQTITRIRENIQEKEKLEPFRPYKMIKKTPSAPVRETAATIRRMNKIMQETEYKEIEWLNTLLNDFKDMPKIEEIEKMYRSEREKKRLLDIQRKHLKGQISYEEAIMAKKKLMEENKKKYESFLKEREAWNSEMEKWRKIEMEKNREQVEKLAMQEAAVQQSKYDNIIKKKDRAKEIKHETEDLLSKAMKQKNEELERRMKLIKDMKVLSIIAKKAKLPKIIDLTETSGLGLLCEMSIAELQERLNILKMDLKEELEKKRTLIREAHSATKRELGETKQLIDQFLNERKEIRKRNKTILEETFDVAMKGAEAKEIRNLKKILAAKRMQRVA